MPGQLACSSSRPCSHAHTSRAHRPAAAHVRRTVVCRAQSKSDFNWTRFNLDKAAKEFLEGLERGEDEDALIARSLGARRISELTELQEKYVDKVKVKLLERVAELKREKDEASYNFKYGKAAYEGGDYFVAEEALERAVRELGVYTPLGGEAAMWLALAYAAVGKEQECIALYKQLEDGHPSSRVQKQAADLRFIMEAPKLKLGEDEKVTIPLLTDAEPNRRTKSYRKFTPAASSGKPISKSYLDDLLDFQAPAFLPPNRFVQVAWAVLLVGTTVYLNYKYSRGEL